MLSFFIVSRIMKTDRKKTEKSSFGALFSLNIPPNKGQKKLFITEPFNDFWEGGAFSVHQDAYPEDF